MEIIIIILVFAVWIGVIRFFKGSVHKKIAKEVARKLLNAYHVVPREKGESKKASYKRILLSLNFPVGAVEAVISSSYPSKEIAIVNDVDLKTGCTKFEHWKTEYSSQIEELELSLENESFYTLNLRNIALDCAYINATREGLTEPDSKTLEDFNKKRYYEMLFEIMKIIPKEL
jgi:hypothetical protein